MTQAMREKLLAKGIRKYCFTLIRIRFPDNTILQGTFSVKETFESVLEFLKENLSNDTHPFHLRTASREILNEYVSDKTLETLNLQPAVILTFFWDRTTDSECPKEYLKSDVLNLLQPL